jgi:hypothetical protein
VANHTKIGRKPEYTLQEKPKEASIRDENKLENVFEELKPFCMEEQKRKPCYSRLISREPPPYFAF